MEYWCWLEILLCKILAHGEVSCGLIQMRRLHTLKKNLHPVLPTILYLSWVPLNTHTVSCQSIITTPRPPKRNNDLMKTLLGFISGFPLSCSDRMNVTSDLEDKKYACHLWINTHWFSDWKQRVLLMVLSMLLYGCYRVFCVVFTVFVHRLKVNGVQNNPGPHRFSLWTQDVSQIIIF